MQGSKSKKWADALNRALHRESAGKGSAKWLDVIAERCIEEAASGDMQAIKEIGDRMDGKPSQTVDGSMNIAGALELTKRVVKGGD